MIELQFDLEQVKRLYAAMKDKVTDIYKAYYERAIAGLDTGSLWSEYSKVLEIAQTLQNAIDLVEKGEPK